VKQCWQIKYCLHKYCYVFSYGQFLECRRAALTHIIKFDVNSKPKISNSFLEHSSMIAIVVYDIQKQ
jgi:hypothetical protein